MVFRGCFEGVKILEGVKKFEMADLRRNVKYRLKWISEP